jgi:hypothetical protein
MHGPLNVKFTVMHVNIANRNTSIYIQHVIFIPGLYSFHCFMCGAIKPPVYMMHIFEFAEFLGRWEWPTVIHTRNNNKIKLGSERTDKFVPRSDLCLINARIVPVDPLYLINL